MPNSCSRFKKPEITAIDSKNPKAEQLQKKGLANRNRFKKPKGGTIAKEGLTSNINSKEKKRESLHLHVAQSQWGCWKSEEGGS